MLLREQGSPQPRIQCLAVSCEVQLLIVPVDLLCSHEPDLFFCLLPFMAETILIFFPAHEGEIPCWLSVRSSAIHIPHLQLVVSPVVLVNIFCLGHIHAIQAQTIKVAQCVATSLADNPIVVLCAVKARARSGRETELCQSVRDGVYRVPQSFGIRRPDVDMVQRFPVPEEGFFFARTVGPKEVLRDI